MSDIELPTVEVTWPEGPAIPGGAEDVLGSLGFGYLGTAGVINAVHTDAGATSEIPDHSRYVRGGAPAVGDAPAGSYMAAAYQQLGAAAPLAYAESHGAAGTGIGEGYRYATVGAAPRISKAPPIQHPATIYREAHLEMSTLTDLGPIAPFKLPGLQSAPEPFTPLPYDDFTNSTAHEWINAIGLRGLLLSVPIAAVTPVNKNITDPSLYNEDYFANVPEGLYGLSFRTPGLLFDVGSPHTSFVEPLIF